MSQATTSQTKIQSTMSQTKIYVGNLPYSCGKEDLEDFFKDCGDLQGVYIPLNDQGRSRGFAFVTFLKSEAMQAALKLDGTDFKGRALRIRVAEERNSRGGDDRGGRGRF